MPAPDALPAGTVWQGQGAYNVYAVADCVPWQWAPGPTQRRRQSVSAQAQGLIDQQCIVLDTESTGIGCDEEVCEIAIVDVDGAVLLDTLIRPCKPIPKEATAIHGITDAMVATAPRWPDVSEQFETLVLGRTVVTYNAAFDARLLRQTHQLHSLTAPPLATACLMQMFATWNGEWDKGRDSWRWLKLIDAATECDAACDGAHRALADARMALGVLRYLQQRRNGKRPARKSKGASLHI